eukprot:Gb_21737 [translate_table: standard]
MYGMRNRSFKDIEKSCEIQLLDFRKNRLTGELPPYLRYFQDLRVLSVGYNKLQGHIPHWITDLTRLQVLDLSNNGFNGTIPPNLQNLQGFGKLGDPLVAGNTLYEDIRINQLSEGRNTKEHRKSEQPAIAQSISEPLWGSNPSISWLYGQIPTGTQFTTFNGSVFERNWSLCGTPLPSCRKRKKAAVPPSSSSSADDEEGGGVGRTNKCL